MFTVKKGRSFNVKEPLRNPKKIASPFKVTVLVISPLYSKTGY